MLSKVSIAIEVEVEVGVELVVEEEAASSIHPEK